MNTVLRLCAALVMSAAVVPATVQAKPLCTTATTARSSATHAVDLKNSSTLQACKDECVAHLGARGSAMGKAPAPSHLPLLSSPDEIADWHAEIFDRLSRKDDGTVFCKVDTDPSPIHAI